MTSLRTALRRFRDGGEPLDVIAAEMEGIADGAALLAALKFEYGAQCPDERGVERARLRRGLLLELSKPPYEARDREEVARLLNVEVRALIGAWVHTIAIVEVRNGRTWLRRR